LPAGEYGRRPPVLETVKHSSLDLALVKIFGRRPIIKVSTKRVKPGDKLRIAGWHLGRWMVVTDGRAALEPGWAGCLVIFGASGGAVVNERGSLVGIFVQLITYEQGGGTHYATHLARYEVLDYDVRKWMKENMK